MNHQIVCTAFSAGILLSTCWPLAAQDDSLEVLGEGSYHITLPDGRERPTDWNGAPVSPRVSGDFKGAVPTNDWSSSLVFPRITGHDHGEAMFPWPLALKASATGLHITVAPPLQPAGNGYTSFFNSAQSGVRVGVAGLSAPETTLAANGDWSVTTESTDGTRTLRATFGRGLPYAWFDVSGDDVEVVVGNDFQLLEQADERLVFSSNGGTYAAFAPEGSTWTIDGITLRSDLANQGRLTVAGLPDAQPSTIELFERHAHAVLLDTRVAWTYEATQGVVLATYSFETVATEGEETQTLAGLFPHQLPYTDITTEGLGFETARGHMELAATNEFTLALPVVPILHGLPVTGNMDLGELRSFLEELQAEDNSINASDSYWSGKQMGRIANAAHIADALGEPEMRDDFLSRVRTELENWLSATTVVSSFRIEAESFATAEGVSIGAGEDGGSAVTEIGDGDRMTYSGVDLAGQTPTRVLLRFASGVKSGGSALIQLRVGGEDGALLSEAALGNTGGWESWTTLPMAVSTETAALLDGSNDLVFRCDTGYPGDVLSLEWIEWDIPSSGGGGSDKDFAYDPTWSTLLANPGSYGLASELNDHHFHYGYMIAAAATLARFDPEWAQPERWGGMVELLIKDPANWDRADLRFPFLRNLDPYMGHSYASGHAGFAAGNNQESSSEAMNFAQAVVLWGDATGREDLRDLGLYMHALEALAIEQYWFDADQVVYPEFAPHPIAGIVWDAGSDYATWWTANPEEIHGINLLPITGGSLYLGRRPEAMQRAWTHLLEQNGGTPVEWRDILWSAHALVDPAAALDWLETDQSWWPESGSSRAHVAFWIQALAELGTLDYETVADTPTAAAFSNNGTRTYVAFNGSQSEREVTFSDGVVLCVPAGATVRSLEPSSCGNNADLDGNGVVNGADLTLMLAAWGACPPKAACIADLDGNGTIDGADLTLLLGAWS